MKEKKSQEPCVWCDDYKLKTEPAYGYEAVHISMFGTYVCNKNRKKIKK